MKNLYLLVAIISTSTAQNGRILQAPHSNNHGWDIRLAVPGQPGNDYPTLATIPRTSFSCAGREPGYYADTDTNCQVFRVCTVGATYGFQSFLCPNGTLFNQAVFVCDWWMNVNCKNSEEVLRNKNDQFENLKLGPQLMKDIKNILTHPVRNPFNTNAMKSKLLVMQSYKPPSGQLFPNGALLAPPERAPSHIYIPTKAIQIALRQNEYRPPSESFAASTFNPQYIPPTFSTFSPTTIRNVEILQRQVLNSGNIHSQSNSSEQIISNGHAGQLQTQTMYSQTMNNFNNEKTNRQLQRYNNFRSTQRAQSNTEFKSLKTKNSNTLQVARTFGNNAQQLRNTDKKNNISNTVAPIQSIKQQYTYETARQPSTKINQTQTSEKLRQSLVSSDIVPPTILTKTLTYSRLVQEPKQSQPKARITFKTWVLKPAKNAKLIANPTPYTYNVPTNSVKEELELDVPYIYNKPSESVSLENTPEPETRGYNYDKPTEPTVEASPTEEEVSPLYVSATTLRPSIDEILLTTTTIPPTQVSRLYLAPESRNPSARQYLPPLDLASRQSSQYFSPKSSLRQLSRYQNAQSLASQSKPTTDYVTSSKIRDKNPLHTGQVSNNNVNHKNLSFSEFLSKEKLDITVNEIVNETDEDGGTESHENFGQYYQKLDSIVSNSLPSESNSEDKEELTERPGTLPKPIKLVAVPSNKLEPPTKTFDNYDTSNKYAKLPFIKETVLPTIERTVTIKITIPESIANILFKTSKDDELEILNTDNSNYLILRNNVNDNTNNNFTPIGKLTWNENFNNSASQALVFSLLVDSINKAKKYNSKIQDNVQSLTTSTPPQFQAVNNEELGRISETISQLTASQFTNNFKTDNLNRQDITSISAKSQYVSNRNENTNIYQENLSNLKYTQKPAGLSQNDKLPYKANNKQSNPNTKTPIYSGQLYKYPVPEVTRQIINAPNPANSNILIQSDIDEVKSQRIVVPKNSITKNTDTSKNINGNIYKNQGTLYPSLRLDISPSEKSQLKTQENNILSTGTGITAQLQDKIVGSVPHPTDKNKFVTYKKDQSYYLYSNLDDGNSVSSEKTAKQNMQSFSNNNYPDLITFHFIPSENEKEKISYQNEAETFQLTELNPVGNNDRTELTDNNVNDDTYSRDLAYNIIRPSQKEREVINTLYDGPSSYSAPQSLIGNLISTKENQRNTFNSRIEDIEGDNNFNGYLKERPARQFTFK